MSEHESIYTVSGVVWETGSKFQPFQGTSLYRALLKQCHELTAIATSSGAALPPSTATGLVRQQFRKHCHLQSLGHIRHVIRQGQSTLRLLHEANKGSIPALTELIGILRKSSKERDVAANVEDARHARVTVDLAKKPTPQELHVLRVSNKANQQPSPSSPGLSAHPYPLSALSSKSRIAPSLHSTTKGIPFLRYAKPPVYLSRVIRQKTIWSDDAYARVDNYNILIDLGRTEDEWDFRMRDLAVSELGAARARDLIPYDGAQTTWRTEAYVARTAVSETIKARNFKNAALGQRMWMIAKQEQCLKNWEELPINVARAARRIRKLEIKVWRFAETSSGKYSFTLRKHNDSIADEVECKKIGRFHPPVEWAVRKIEREAIQPRQLEAMLRSNNHGGSQPPKPKEQASMKGGRHVPAWRPYRERESKGPAIQQGRSTYATGGRKLRRGSDPEGGTHLFD